ncbi:YwqG family protein [Actinoplanes sp. NPDC023714]|uniref:YwqG family protein n=1 Tax=Actinoplanes sp. NPDC023714 TaxID=3154322 RepID=UPI0033D955C5
MIDLPEWLPRRPAIRLRAASPGDVVVGQLGGSAALPVGHPWPMISEEEPFTFVARLDCGALSEYEVDLELPRGGSLLFFLPRLEEVGDESLVLYVPDGVETAGRLVPDHLRHPSEEYDHPLVELTGQPILTVPRPYHPVLDHDRLAAVAELWRRRRSTPGHQVGGYSDVFQGPLEVGAACATFRPYAGDSPHADPEFLTEARKWVTLLHLEEDSDARMGWGDGGIALWAIRREDLAARDFGATYFTTQSH